MAALGGGDASAAAPLAGSLSGTVCEGSNGNGVCELGEAGIPGVTVSLTYAGADGAFGTGDDITRTTATDADGVYAFTGLPAGAFRVVETNLPAYNSLADADGGAPDQINLTAGVNQVLTGKDFEDGPVSIGLAKSLSGIASNGDGSFTATFVLTVANLGGASLTGVQVSDNLAATFAAAQSFAVVEVSSPEFTVAPAYDGDTRTDMLAGSDTLAIAGAGTVTLRVRVTPGSLLGGYENQASASGTTAAGTTVADVSDDGLEPDANHNGDATEPGENDPTPVQFVEHPALGVAKQVQNIGDNGDGSYAVTFELRVQNLGDVPLSNIQVADDLRASFSGANSFTVDTIGSPDFTLSDTYDGAAHVQVLAGTDTLAPGRVGAVTIDATVRPGGKKGPYGNQALGSGASPAGAQVSDLSDAGIEPDANHNGSAADAGEDDATLFYVRASQAVGLAMRLTAAVPTGPASYELTYELRVANMGWAPLHNLQVVDNLGAAFAGVAGIGDVHASSPTLTTNAAFNGVTNANILAGVDALDPGLTASIWLTAVVTPGAALGPFGNLATVAAMDPSNAPVSDLSQDGADPDPSGDGNPSESSPTSVVFAKIGGNVYRDLNANGAHESNEPGLAQVTVSLSDGRTMQTDASGLFGFVVLPGAYTLTETNRSGYVSTGDSEGANDDRISVQVTGGQASNGNFFLDDFDSDGDRIPDGLEGYTDRDKDGVPNALDYDPSGYLYDIYTGQILSGGSVSVNGPGQIAVVSNGATGAYAFYTDGTAGVYTLAVTAPPGYTASPSCLAGDPPAFDPTGGPNPTNLGGGRYASTAYLSSSQCSKFYRSFNLQPGDPFIINNNFPFHSQTRGALGNRVWWDVNGNGQQDNGEPGIPDVTVVLSGAASATTTTDASGLYAFTNLAAGTYNLAIAASEFASGGTLANWTGSPQNVGSDASDSDADPVTHSLTQALGSGVEDFSVAFGLQIASALAVTQQLNTYSTVRIGDPISLTIRITNTGHTWITGLPLSETYSPTYVKYGVGGMYAVPASGDNNNDGVIQWQNLTASSAHALASQRGPAGGLGTDLGPGASLAAVVWLTAVQDTTGLQGGVTTFTAQVAGATSDPDGSAGPLPALGAPPGQQAAAAVRIMRPTGVDVYDLRAEVVSGDIVLSWQTGAETGIVGFRVLRVAADGSATLLTPDLLAAEFPGSSTGAHYRFADPGGCRDARCVYQLEVVTTDGEVARVGEVLAASGQNKVFEPLLLRAR